MENGSGNYTYRWEFGDGTTANGRAVSHAYNATGNYTATVTIIEEGPVLVDIERVNVTVVNASATPSVDAELETTVNNVNAPLRVAVQANATDANVTGIRLLYPNSTIANTTRCDAPTCNATLSVVPRKSTWNDTAGQYESAGFTVQAVTDSDDINVTAVPVSVLIEGDATGDGIVDVFDGGAVGQAWQKGRNDPKYTDEADLNNDGQVDADDLAIVRAHWKETAS